MLSEKHRKASFKVLVVCEVDLAERLQPHSTVTSTDACAITICLLDPPIVVVLCESTESGKVRGISNLQQT